MQLTQLLYHSPSIEPFGATFAPIIESFGRRKAPRGHVETVRLQPAEIPPQWRQAAENPQVSQRQQRCGRRLQVNVRIVRDVTGRGVRDMARS